MNLSAVNVRNFLVYCILCRFRICDGLKDFSKRCRILADFKLKNLCTADYPEEVKLKYLDKHVEIGESYTVFSVDGREGYYMISHGYSDLTDCNEITVTSPHRFGCDKYNKIYIESAILHCLPFHTQLADDLISYCSEGEEKSRVAFTAMLYVEGSPLYEEDDGVAGGSRIMQIGFFIFVPFSLMQLIFSGGSTDLSARCQVLDGIKLKNICTGSYPREVRQRYADKHVKTGLSYTVFTLDDREGYYLISHGYSDLTKCDEITLTSARDFQCNGQDIRLRSARLHCLLFPVHLTDDLISHCLKGVKQPKAEFTAMLYVEGSTLYEESDIVAGGSRLMHIGLFIFLPFRNLSSRCQVLNNLKLKMICTDSYSQRIKQIYDDKYVEEGLSYTIFALDRHEGYYMISHGYSDLTKCDQITLTSPRDFDCNGHHIYLESAIMHCIPFHIHITDDLMARCDKGKVQASAVFTAMHYVHGTILYDKSGATADGCRINLLFIVASFIVMQFK
uniref:Uncharacterized protein n=1 Tax=Glossina palpalis gambiensis TaxID=67801 RepID=A0A3F2Z4M0_9MUSC